MVSKLLSRTPDTNCGLDPIPAYLLKQCSNILLPIITNINYMSIFLSPGIFPVQFKCCSVHPYVIKCIPDKDDLSNYCPISHLSFLSKITGRIVKLHFVDYLPTVSIIISSLPVVLLCTYYSPLGRNLGFCCHCFGWQLE